MPFTLSHPAAILLLRPLRLPVAALAIGSMVPDLPLFVPGWTYSFSHGPVGMVTVDLVAGSLLTLVWWTILRPPLIDAAPRPVRERVPARPSLSPGTAVAVAPAVVIGAASHIAWDEFTHEGRWGERHVPWLSDRHWGVGGIHWAQGVSSVLGLAVVGLALLAALRRLQATPRPTRVPGFALPAGAAVIGVTIVAGGLAAVAVGGDLHHEAFAAATVGLPAAAAAVVVSSLVWWRLARTRGHDGPPDR